MTIDSRGKPILDRWRAAEDVASEILKTLSEYGKQPIQDKAVEKEMQRRWMQAKEQADAILTELQPYRLDLPRRR